MMLTGLQSFLKSLPLDGKPGKSGPVDPETIQPISFGEVLKLKEKQLQQTQEVSASSIAAAFAALQTVALGISSPLPDVETRELSGEADVSKPSQAAMAQLSPTLTETSDSSTANQASMPTFNAAQSANSTFQAVSDAEGEAIAPTVLPQTISLKEQSTQMAPALTANSATNNASVSWTDQDFVARVSKAPTTKQETSSVNSSKSDLVTKFVSAITDNNPVESTVRNQGSVMIAGELPQQVINGEKVKVDVASTPLEETEQPVLQTNGRGENSIPFSSTQPTALVIKESFARSATPASNTAATDTLSYNGHEVKPSSSGEAVILNSTKPHRPPVDIALIQTATNEKINTDQANLVENSTVVQNYPQSTSSGLSGAAPDRNTNIKAAINTATLSSSEPEFIDADAQQTTAVFEANTDDKITPGNTSFKSASSVDLETFQPSTQQVIAETKESQPAYPPLSTTKVSALPAQTTSENENAVVKPSLEKQTLNTSPSLPETAASASEGNETESFISESAFVMQQPGNPTAASVRTTSAALGNKALTSDTSTPGEVEMSPHPSSTQNASTVDAQQPQNQTTKIQNEQIPAVPETQEPEFVKTALSETTSVSDKRSLTQPASNHEFPVTLAQTEDVITDKSDPVVSNGPAGIETIETVRQAFIPQDKSLEGNSEPEAHAQSNKVSSKITEQSELVWNSAAGKFSDVPASKSASIPQAADVASAPDPTPTINELQTDTSPLANQEVVQQLETAPATSSEISEPSLVKSTPENSQTTAGSPIAVRQESQATDAQDVAKTEVRQPAATSATLQGNQIVDEPPMAPYVRAEADRGATNEPSGNSANVAAEKTAIGHQTDPIIEIVKDEALPELENEADISETTLDFATKKITTMDKVDAESLLNNTGQSINVDANNFYEQTVLATDKAVPQESPGMKSSPGTAPYDEALDISEAMPTSQPASQPQEIRTSKINSDTTAVTDPAVFSQVELDSSRTETELTDENIATEAPKNQMQTRAPAAKFETSKVATDARTVSGFQLEKSSAKTIEMSVATVAEPVESTASLVDITVDKNPTGITQTELEPSKSEIEVSNTNATPESEDVEVSSNTFVKGVAIPQVDTEISEGQVDAPTNEKSTVKFETVKKQPRETSTESEIDAQTLNVSDAQSTKPAAAETLSLMETIQSKENAVDTTVDTDQITNDQKIDSALLKVEAPANTGAQEIAVPKSDSQVSIEKAAMTVETVEKQTTERTDEPEIATQTTKATDTQGTKPLTAKPQELSDSRASAEMYVAGDVESNHVSRSPQEEVSRQMETATTEKKIAADFQNVETQVKTIAEEIAVTQSIPEVSAKNANLPDQEKTISSVETSKVQNVEHKNNEENIRVDVVATLRDLVATEPADGKKVSADAEPMESNIPSVDLKEKSNTEQSSSVNNFKDVVGESRLPAASLNDQVIPVSSKLNITQGTKEESTAKQPVKDEEARPVEKQPKLNQTPIETAAVSSPGREQIGLHNDAPSSQVNTHAAEVVQQVMRHINSNLKSGSNSMHLQLNPKELGTIDIQMVSNSQGVRVTFVAEQASTSKLLETQLPQLRESLTDSGVQLAGLDISQHQQSGQKGETFEQSTNFARTSRRDLPQGDSKAQQTQSAERRYGQTSEVDYLI